MLLKTEVKVKQSPPRFNPLEFEIHPAAQTEKLSSEYSSLLPEVSSGAWGKFRGIAAPWIPSFKQELMFLVLVVSQQLPVQMADFNKHLTKFNLLFYLWCKSDFFSVK